jgi:DNA-binding response OmpR family regulator
LLSFLKPTVFIVYNNNNNNDITSVLAGIFWLNGFEPFKFTNGKECLKRFREIDGNVDAVVINQEIAMDNELMLIVNIKRINPDAKIIVIAEEELDKTRILGYGADEFGLKPMSPENIADKVLILMSRETVLENR